MAVLPAAPVYKMTMIFFLGRQGWTESFYINSASAAAAQAAVNQIVPLRQACLANNVTMDGVRLSTVGVRGSTLPIGVPAPGAVGGTALQPDANECLLFSLRFSGVATADVSSTYRRNYLVRGHSPSWVTVVPPQGAGIAANTLGTQVFPQALTGFGKQNFATYFNTLQSLGFGDKINVKTTVPAIIASVLPDTANNIVFTCTAAVPFLWPATVLLAGFTRGFKALNGTKAILPNLVPNPNAFTIAGPMPAGIFFPPAFAQLKVVGVANLTPPTQPLNGPAVTTCATFLRTTDRKTGKIFFATPGKSKTRPVVY